MISFRCNTGSARNSGEQTRRIVGAGHVEGTKFCRRKSRKASRYPPSGRVGGGLESARTHPSVTRRCPPRAKFPGGFRNQNPAAGVRHASSRFGHIVLYPTQPGTLLKRDGVSHGRLQGAWVLRSGRKQAKSHQARDQKKARGAFKDQFVLGGQTRVQFGLRERVLRRKVQIR